MPSVSGIRQLFRNWSRRSRSTSERESGSETSVTDYRSMQDTANKPRKLTRSGSSNASLTLTNPVEITPSHEVLLADQRNLHVNRCRGFSTSIHDMYSSSEFERVDCCALTCGGIFQSDRDRFILQGIEPPGLQRRFWLHIMLPVLIFATAAFGAMRIPEQYLNQFFSTGLVAMLFFYVGMQCYKGRSKRIEIRKDLLFAKAQLQRDRDMDLRFLLENGRPESVMDEDEGDAHYLGQRQEDFSCAHPCCFFGCYSEDRPAYLYNEADDNGEEAQTMERVRRKDARRRVHHLDRFIWDFCTPTICGAHPQCCGMCAVAQEGREIEAALLPAAYRRLDYLTLQPYADYYPGIYRKRHGFAAKKATGDGQSIGETLSTKSSSKSSIHESEPNMPVLSQLSWQLLQLAGTVTILVFVWCIVGKFFWKQALGLNIPDWRIFNLADFLVFLAAWGQTLVMMCFLAWLCNRPMDTNLSVDAMIKYFASGFCLSTTLAVVWECILGLLVRTFISIGMFFAGIGVVIDEDGYQDTGSSDSSTSPFDGTDLWIGFGKSVMNPRLAVSTQKEFLRAFGRDHPVFYTCYLLISAFVLAAFVEEACKYFGYRMVEHPDLLGQRDLEQAVAVAPVLPHQESNDREDNDDSPSVPTTLGTQRWYVRDESADPPVEHTDFSKQRKSMQAYGGAVTLAMICVAMGFTCCENLVYIFIYSGGPSGNSATTSLYAELSVLIARSFFPVHPIAAAMQSIRVIERDVEVTRTARLGNILTPAILFHGSYDFFILWIDFMAEREYGKSGTSFEGIAGILSLVVSIGLLTGTLTYYVILARRQRARLTVTDRSIAAGHSRLV